jgi:hypothetical protein
VNPSFQAVHPSSKARYNTGLQTLLYSFSRVAAMISAPLWMVSSRRLQQRPPYFIVFSGCRLGGPAKSPSHFRAAVAGSATARVCAKTPKSQIKFPLEARIARQQWAMVPLPDQSAQVQQVSSPPARLFTRSGKWLGAATRSSSRGYEVDKGEERYEISQAVGHDADACVLGPLHDEGKA